VPIVKITNRVHVLHDFDLKIQFFWSYYKETAACLEKETDEGIMLGTLARGSHVQLGIYSVKT